MGLSRTDYIVYGWKLPLNMTDKDGNEINFWDDKFLPYIEGHKGEEYDLYYCDTEPTVIARYGDEGYQYMSGMVFAHPDGNEPLYEAKKRAIEKGLIKK